MPVWLQAAFWGLLSGFALVIGAAIGYFVRLSDALVAAIMAFGAGVLISALSFELMLESVNRGGLGPAVGGFLGGLDHLFHRLHRLLQLRLPRW